ncbi:MAG: low molecular weight protein arginine phosphatase [Gemmatimonadetes bacterium]|nr:low molecular weight protein arginine phosphatase [Gemmatimonadota bacterium]
MTSPPEEPADVGNEPTTYNLLFVCSGNTCRSPLARGIAEERVARRGWTHVRVASAGTAALPELPASENALAIAEERGLDLSAHRSRALTHEALAWADLVLVMSPSQLLAVADLGAADKVALATDFLDGPGMGAAIEDPFGGDMDAYRRTFEQIREAVDGVLDKLEPILAP